MGVGGKWRPGATAKPAFECDLCTTRAVLPVRVSELVFVMLRGFHEPGTHPDGEEMKAAQSRLDWA